MAVVHVPPSEATPVAKKLLAAAADLGYNPTTAVLTQTDGLHGFAFIVPDDVRDRAFGIIDGEVEVPGDTGEAAAGDTPETAPESEGDAEPTPKRRGRPRKQVTADEEVSE